MSMDEEKKLLSFEALEGSTVQERYNVYKGHFHAIPKGEGCVVKITLEFEKQNEGVPPPEKELNFLAGLIADIDSHICNKITPADVKAPQACVSAEKAS